MTWKDILIKAMHIYYTCPDLLKFGHYFCIYIHTHCDKTETEQKTQKDINITETILKQ